MIPNASTQSIHLSVATVANNIGRAEDSNRSGKFHGSFTQSSTKPQIQPNLFERMKNCNELSPRIFAAQNEFSLEISSRINAIKEYVAESSSRSKQYMPRKFAEMSSKFRFGQEFVEKPGISPNFVDRCLHYFCTILYVDRSSTIDPDVLAIGCCCNPSRVVKCTSMF